MLTDFANADADIELSADVCVAGAGAAGITVARALAAAGVDVLLLESGGADFDAATQDLAAGENAGLPYYPLRDARLRFFGGTTAIWGGRVAELDPIDFERRDHVPHSGWPVSHAEMVPWFARAFETLGLKRVADQDAHWQRIGWPRPAFDPDRLDLRFWQFDDVPDRFTLARCGDLVAAPHVRVLLNATVTRIEMAEDGGAVAGLRFGNLLGRRGRARARHYVLALGGIETPRIMLASRDQPDRGLGGEALGRFFMEHPHGRGGEVQARRLMAALSLLPRSRRMAGRRQAAVIRLSAAAQRREGVLNSSLTLAVRRPAGTGAGAARAAYGELRHSVPGTRAWRRLWRAAKGAAVRYREAADPIHPWLAIKAGGKGLYAVLRAEQAPNPDSRITLSDQRDALGVPRARLDWRLGEIDRRSARVLVETLGAELDRLGVGRVIPEPWLVAGEGPHWVFDPGIGNHPIGGYHHMGTTRMSAGPADGVVDRHCRVHGVANLHIAGSSVFATAGWANPTLPIIAFAQRLAARLADRPRA